MSENKKNQYKNLSPSRSLSAEDCDEKTRNPLQSSAERLQRGKSGEALNKNNQYKNYSFPGQHEGEEIKLVLRKHLIVLLPHFAYISLMFLLPVLFYIFFAPAVFSAFLSAPYDRLFIILSLVYYGFIWIIAFTVWVDYYLDIWIITNERLLDIEQVGFFNRIVSELDLKRIQDITSRVHGILPTMFGFGNIHLQTAAEKSKFDMKSIPHPVTTRRQITKLYRAAKERDRLVFRDRDE